MDTYTVIRNGVEMDVEANSPEEAAAKAKQAESVQSPVTASGLGKAAATGARGGLEGIAAAPGDLVTWEMSKAAQLAQYLGASPETVEAIKNYGQEKSTGAGGITLPGMATTPDVQAATDKGVQMLPESISKPVQDITRHQAANTAEEWAQTGGSFLGAAALPGGPALRAARVAIPTIATEGAGQITRKLAPEYEDAARVVAGIISGVGVEGATGGFRLRRNLSKIGGDPAALNRVKQLLVEQGMSPKEAATAMKELGPDATLMDTGGVARQEGQQIQARGGEGRGVIDPVLREREAGTNARLGTDVEAAVGPEVQRTDILAALKDRAQALSPEYEAAHKAQVKPVETQGISDAIDSDLAVVKSPEVTAALERIKRSLKLRGTEEMDPSTEGLHEARKAIDNELYYGDGRPRDVGTATSATLKRYRTMIDEALGEAGPIKEVDAKRAQVGKEERAFEGGQEVYDTQRGQASPTEFQRTWDAMSEGEKARSLEGLNVETYRQIGVNASDRVKLQNLMKGEGKWNQAKVATVIGEEKAQALMDALQREKVFQETHQKVVQGSKTAESSSQGQQGLGAAVMDATPDVIAGGLIAGPGGASVAALGKLRTYLTNRLRSSGQPKRDANVARLLASQRPDDLMEAFRIMQDHQSFTVPAGILGGMLARRQEQQEQKDQREP